MIQDKCAVLEMRGHIKEVTLKRRLARARILRLIKISNVSEDVFDLIVSLNKLLKEKN